MAAQVGETKTKKKFLPFEEARQFVHSLGLKSREEYIKWCKSGKKPGTIPSYPNEVPAYSTYWKGWGDWLGTGRTKEFLPFEEARQFVHSVRLENSIEWSKYCKSGKKPGTIPSYPNGYIKKSGKV